nr:hypothetical protein TorRG33x02_207250 [Ipomoea trifida]
MAVIVEFYMNKCVYKCVCEKGRCGYRDKPQAQRETAFHFLISNFFPFFVEDDGAAPLEPSPAGTIVTSVSRDAIPFKLGIDSEN